MIWVGWSWILTAIGVLGLYFAGRGMWQGWAVGLAAQALWIWYATATEQWGFYVSACAYGLVYTLNLVRWRDADARRRRAAGDRPLDDPDSTGRDHSPTA